MFEAVRRLISEEAEASLGSVEGEAPFVSATNYLFENREGKELGNFYFLLSDLAQHTKNIKKNRRVSLLIVSRKPERPLLERARVTVVGEIDEASGKEEEKRLREGYQKRFPWADILFTLPGFHFYRMRPRQIHWIGGFGQVQKWDLSD